MGRKPKYENPDQIIQAFMASVADSYRHPGKDEVGEVNGRKKQELLAEEFGISRIKVRKILITTGDITSPIFSLIAQGLSTAEVAQKLNLSKSTVNSWVGYSKGVYKLSDVSAVADRTRLYRERKAAVAELKEVMDETALWKAVCLFQGYSFMTAGRRTKDDAKGQEKFKYTVSDRGSADGEETEGFGNEIFVNGLEKGISRSSVDYAFSAVKEKGDVFSETKQLKIYGMCSFY